VSASRSAQNLDQVAIAPTDARGASAPKVVGVDALRLALFPVVRPRAAREVVPERDQTFDELLHGWGGTGRRRSRWFRRHRAARASGGTRR
jgi:hypothetical protein